MNLSPIEAFSGLLRNAAARRLAELRAQIERAVLLGQSLETLRAAYLAAESVEAGITWPADDAGEAEAVAALAAQWPADFPPLPVWFTDPAASADLDPLGAPCVVSFAEGAA